MRRFTLRPEHIELLRAAYVRWDDCEYGAPAIDPKRPYGNSDVEGDIARILHWRPDDGSSTEDPAEVARQLHRETQDALSLILNFCEIEPGDYAYDRSRGWFAIEPGETPTQTLRWLQGEGQ